MKKFIRIFIIVLVLITVPNIFLTNNDIRLPTNIVKLYHGKEYSQDYCVFVNFSIPSGQDRFCIYSLKEHKIIAKSICLHGMGEGNTPSKPVFSNRVGSLCSSLGRYEIAGAYYMRDFAIIRSCCMHI